MPRPPFPPLPDPAGLAPHVVALCREAAEGIEFESFLVGVRAARLARSVPEDAFQAWKGALRRLAGGVLAEDWVTRGRRPEFVRPELLLVFDADRDQVEPRLRPVYVYGRYRKLVRDLPQTQARWKHEPCRGKGCPECEGTGKLYRVALEDLLGAPAARAFQAEGWQLHGLGREDVDVRCLGPGRPFVLELVAPRRRQADLIALGAEIAAAAAGRVELARPLVPAGEEAVPRLKASEARKEYRARVRPQRPPDPEALLRRAAALTGCELAQRTPERVSRRRADKVRPRRVHECQLLGQDPEGFDLRLVTAAGTYIKELISGDEGRTTPSVTELLGVPCVCAELDVLGVEADDAALLAPASSSSAALTGAEEGVESVPYDAG